MNNIMGLIPLFYYDVLAVIFFFTLLFAFRNCSKGAKIKVLYILCIINLLAYIVNDYYFYSRGDNILTLFPLQLCNISVFLIPLMLYFERQILYDFAFYVCALGAFAALIIPSSDYIGRTYSLMTISFFVFHFIIVAVPFLLAGWGIYRPRPTMRSIVNLSMAVFGIAMLMHLLNMALYKLFNVNADYFFTIIIYSAPRNPAFELFSRIIPYNLFYLLPALPILWIYILLISLPWNYGKWFGKRRIINRNEERLP